MAKIKSLEQTRKEFVIATLRRASYRWFERSKALSRARVSRGLYKCETCSNLVKKAEIQLDHINPIVPLTGFDSWTGYIERLLCDASGFATICKYCHSSKTATERELRRINRNKLK